MGNSKKQFNVYSVCFFIFFSLLSTAITFPHFYENGLKRGKEIGFEEGFKEAEWRFIDNDLLESVEVYVDTRGACRMDNYWDVEYWGGVVFNDSFISECDGELRYAIDVHLSSDNGFDIRRFDVKVNENMGCPTCTQCFCLDCKSYCNGIIDRMKEEE